MRLEPRWWDEGEAARTSAELAGVMKVMSARLQDTLCVSVRVRVRLSTRLPD